MSVAPPSHPTGTTANSADDSTLPMILVVDDNPENLSVALRFLSDEPFDIAVAVDGASALESAGMVRPQLILLDVMLPDISGFELCKRLKAQAALRETPVIFMTALNEPTYKVQGFAAGGVDYLTKPLERLELLARVHSHLRIYRQTRSLQAVNQNLQKTNEALALHSRNVADDNRKLRQLVHIDGLTQVGNRRYFDERLQQEWLRLRREQKPLSLILLDIDYFKNYNDRYGHPAGDTCLSQIAQAVKRILKRPGDTLTRYGGEEFAVILPNVDTTGAVYVADHIQAEVSRLAIPHEASSVASIVTVSQGISTTVPQVGTSCLQLLQSSDKALYLAKQQGRNQSVHRQQVFSVEADLTPQTISSPQNTASNSFAKGL